MQPGFIHNPGQVVLYKISKLKFESFFSVTLVYNSII